MITKGAPGSFKKISIENGTIYAIDGELTSPVKEDYIRALWDVTWREHPHLSNLASSSERQERQDWVNDMRSQLPWMGESEECPPEVRLDIAKIGSRMQGEQEAMVQSEVPSLVQKPQLPHSSLKGYVRKLEETIERKRRRASVDGPASNG
ncbi:hypothetical protein BU26DRAFT_519499 [Trematosphaeria pertusa]|uniref:Uncharacterized protein n=1 Tax=Trematosphaeria pertusa TaxID=390896 RepID=A0A6A6IIN5_9PLEO|nr:uncharacterized protein BU26DRAFT_519499 [Trematosphaeria pertusa]KAF2249430.1 hypothetical protein BU26DRAFT_519499 [Trematosphaeria pertusa]